MATGIAPPKEHLNLGDAIRFHHRACVARVRRVARAGTDNT